MRKELAGRKGLTLQRLWQEYREEHADGFAYSRYCALCREWKARQDPVMLQEHTAGEKLSTAPDAMDGDLRQYNPTHSVERAGSGLRWAPRASVLRMQGALSSETLINSRQSRSSAFQPLHGASMIRPVPARVDRATDEVGRLPL